MVEDEVAAIDRRLNEPQAERTRIVQDQQRLRENMKALRGSAEERPLLQRYTRQLDVQENRLAALQEEVATATAERATATADFVAPHFNGFVRLDRQVVLMGAGAPAGFGRPDQATFSRPPLDATWPHVGTCGFGSNPSFYRFFQFRWRSDRRRFLHVMPAIPAPSALALGPVRGRHLDMPVFSAA